MIAGLKKHGHWEGSKQATPIKKATPKKAVKKKTPKKETPVDEPLTEEQYNKLLKGSLANLTPAIRKQMTDYRGKQIKGAKENAYNKPFLIVNDREIWVDNKYIMKLGDQLVDTDSKILGWFSKNDLWAKYNKYKYPKDPPAKKGLKWSHKDEGSIDLPKETRNGIDQVLRNKYSLNTQKEARDRYIQDKMDNMWN